MSKPLAILALAAALAGCASQTHESSIHVRTPSERPSACDHVVSAWRTAGTPQRQALLLRDAPRLCRPFLTHGEYEQSWLRHGVEALRELEGRRVDLRMRRGPAMRATLVRVDESFLTVDRGQGSQALSPDVLTAIEHTRTSMDRPRGVLGGALIGAGLGLLLAPVLAGDLWDILAFVTVPSGFVTGGVLGFFGSPTDTVVTRFEF